MATITRRVEVCDVCRDIDKPVVEHVRIAREGGRLRTYAFCKGDLKPLEGTLTDIMAVAPVTRPRGSKQVTMEQIDQIKAKRATRKPKKATESAV
jgi:hypothetical protein